VTEDNALVRIQGIFRDILDDSSLCIDRQSSPDTIAGWDSIVNVNIIIAVEEEFGVKFSVDELQLVKSVGNILELLEKKI